VLVAGGRGGGSVWSKSSSGGGLWARTKKGRNKAKKTEKHKRCPKLPPPKEIGNRKTKHSRGVSENRSRETISDNRKSQRQEEQPSPLGPKEPVRHGNEQKTPGKNYEVKRKVDKYMKME